MKLSNEGCDLLVVAPEHVLHGRRQIQILYALRGPIGSDLAAAHTPHLFGIGLEEDLEQPPAKPVAHPLLEAFLAERRKGASPDIARHDARRFGRAEAA